MPYPAVSVRVVLDWNEIDTSFSAKRELEMDRLE